MICPEFTGQWIPLLEKFTYGYDKAGNRTSVTTGTANTNYAANQLNQTTRKQGFGPTVFSGTLDEPALVTVNGQSATVMSDGGAAPYTFEALVHLAEGSNTVTIEATDGSGNTATKRYSVTTGGVQKTLQYDLNGNLRYEKDASGTVLREFQWDAKNRLVKIIDGIHETHFRYDGLDRRVGIVEKENGVEQSNQVFIWENTQIVQRRASNGSTVERSYYGDGFEEGAADYFYTKDHLGSIREVVASNGQTVEAVYDYSPWGEVTKTGGSGVESDFLYTGHFFHDERDLHLTLYRAYHPELGMWLSRDPIAENGGINLYAYVGNNPINWWDPLGLFRFGKRPLKGGNAPWIPGCSSNPIDNYFNTELSHEHGFFEDGKDAEGNLGGRSETNIGFRPDGRFSEDPAGRGYRYDDKHYDDDLIREALKNIEDGEYSRIGNNCQDFCDKIRDEYDRLLEEEEQTGCDN